jgi:hypothetical protein
MATLSIARTTKVRTLDGLKPVAELPAAFKVVDWYGNLHEARVEGVEDRPRIMFRTISGEAVAFGEGHTVYCRAKGDGRWMRRNIADITDPHFVRMPQRKLSIDDIVAQSMDGDNTGVFLAPKTPLQLLPLMEGAATAGLLVQREKAELKIKVEPRRPSCFAAKLINGNFELDLEGSLSALVSKAIIQPHGPFNSEYVEKCKEYGVIFEGSTLYNDLLLFPMEAKKAKAPCYTITVDDDVPIETTWFCT